MGIELDYDLMKALQTYAFEIVKQDAREREREKPPDEPPATEQGNRGT